MGPGWVSSLCASRLALLVLSEANVIVKINVVIIIDTFCFFNAGVFVSKDSKPMLVMRVFRSIIE